MPGTNYNTTLEEVVQISLTAPNGLGTQAQCFGDPNVVATQTLAYTHGCIMRRVDGTPGFSALYENIGTAITPSWSPIAGGGGGNPNYLYDLSSNITADGINLALYTTLGVPTLDWGNRILLDSATVGSVSWQSRLLLDGAGTQSIDWNNRQTLDSVGNTTINWTNKYLVETSTISVDWGNRLLKNTNGTTTTFDWQNCVMNDQLNQNAIRFASGDRALTDNSGAPSVRWDDRQLKLNSGEIVVDWQNSTLTYSGGFGSVDWKNQHLRDSGGVLVNWATKVMNDSTYTASVSWNSRVLRDSVGTSVLDWFSKNLIDGSGTNSLDWGNRTTFDTGNVLSMDWNSRVLTDTTGVAVAYWNEGFRSVSGNTASRPTVSGAGIGVQYFDTDLGIPIWWRGADWVNASGAIV